jgi:hypothetical protein
MILCMFDKNAVLLDAKALEALLNGVDHQQHHLGVLGQQEDLMRSKSLPADFHCFSDTGTGTCTRLTSAGAARGSDEVQIPTC